MLLQVVLLLGDLIRLGRLNSPLPTSINTHSLCSLGVSFIIKSAIAFAILHPEKESFACLCLEIDGFYLYSDVGGRHYDITTSSIVIL